ncbi:MAG: helix-turn-helix transcriptional regulator [Alphaproteobacteria bacterium]|nr:helix-turn-helix transcriptional regulator [Alphaproteobacteria bacterium]
MIAHSLSAGQIKAARALLDWSQESLSQATSLSIATVRKLECGSISPRQTTMFVIRNALEEAGIEFIDADGVRRRTEEVSVYRGVSGRKNFFADLYETARKAGSDIALIDTPDGSLTNGEEAIALFKMIEENTASFVKCLLTSPINPVLESAQVEWRLISRNYIDPMPICICGDIFAMISGAKGEDVKIVTMRSLGAAHASRKQFFSIWEKATQIQAQGNTERALRCVSS